MNVVFQIILICSNTVPYGACSRETADKAINYFWQASPAICLYNRGAEEILATTWVGRRDDQYVHVVCEPATVRAAN
jgi:hypothetical protein